MLYLFGKEIIRERDMGFSFKERKPLQIRTVINILRIISLIPAMYAIVYFLCAFFYVTGIELYNFLTVGIEGLYEYYIK